ncbi:MAG TPA: efflux transporter outer membrane subunit [Steroidobacteraceae bacterium]|nr:efflux transporter outer membrane subunit [Steroidobacteraceae bacterium]
MLLLAIATLLPACSLGPRYKRPAIQPPAAWRTDVTETAAESAAEGGANASASGATDGPMASQAAKVGATPAWPSADWWRGFGSAQLDDLISQAQHANDDLAAAIARVREADAQAQIAGAPLLPALGASADATRQRQKPTGALPTASPVTFSQFSALAAASYELDFWGKNRATHDAAKLAARASRYDRATVELAIMTSVATTYFQAIELHDRLNVAEQDLSSAQTVLKDLQLEEQVGTAAALDVAQQETTVAVLNATIPPLRQQLRQSIDALAVLVGRMPQDLEIPQSTLTDLSEPSVGPGLPSELLARRPDVAEAEAELMSANANIAAARAAFFPSIDLTADGGFVSTALSSLITPVNRVFALSGDVTQQVFAGGALLGNYRLNKARYAELLADYHKAVISAFSNVEDALVAAQQTAEQYRRQQQAVSKARRAYEITEIQLHAGTVNVLTVLNTQTTLFTAEDELVQARFAHFQALVQLFSALGGGWQQEQAARSGQS